MTSEKTSFPTWGSEPVYDAIVDELVGINGSPFDITIEPGEARLIAARIIGSLRRLGRENDPVVASPPKKYKGMITEWYCAQCQATGFPGTKGPYHTGYGRNVPDGWATISLQFPREMGNCLYPLCGDCYATVRSTLPKS